MTPSRSEIAADLRAAIELARNEPDTRVRKFRLQALEMLLTEYDGEET